MALREEIASRGIAQYFNTSLCYSKVAVLKLAAGREAIYGVPGGVIHDGAVYRIFLKTLKDRLRKNIGLTVMDAHINDDSFVDACVDQLITFIDEKKDQS
ncbi:MAG: Tm-1-like ATP-binding domain-containing protein [Deltaproteobacteria bacterium]|nr:Tm-1-like ATP-binding domain-containing protein [Deltaproteobacteria bacterium]